MCDPNAKSTGDQIDGQSTNSEDEQKRYPNAATGNQPSKREDDSSKHDQAMAPPRDGNYAPIEPRPPMEEDENGEVVGPGSKTYVGLTGHKGR